MAEPPPGPSTRPIIGVQNRPAPRVPDRGSNPAVAARLHEAVRAAGGNQAVARRSGVPLATVNNYVRGRNGMKIEPLSALAVACNVSLEWLVAGAGVSASGVPADAAFSTADMVRSHGLGEVQAEVPPAGMISGVDLRILTKAIEVVAAIADVADFHADSKGLARRIATTYAVLSKPERPPEVR
jgi:transcriptional regulator with XRE-family HTH domain